LDFLDTYRVHVQQVTIAQIKQALQAHLDISRMAEITVGQAGHE
jgi:predicted Zn-dependent peptidase